MIHKVAKELIAVIFVLTAAYVTFAGQGAIVKLPGEEGTKPAISPSPFPDRMSAYVWRNLGLVERPLLAETVGARPEDIAVVAVLELMAHEVNGKTKFFRGCPDEWTEVSFENLSLPDGSRVSGSRINGVTRTFHK